uniref:Uncharacterized protein n=1 Tax=Macaca fascicularis TaxID=9541 RepID=A0A7N9D5H6_MACFA
CWKWNIGIKKPQNILCCLTLCNLKRNSSRVHVHNVQVCYIFIHVPCWFAEPINSSFTLETGFHSV